MKTFTYDYKRVFNQPHRQATASLKVGDKFWVNTNGKQELWQIISNDTYAEMMTYQVIDEKENKDE